MQTAKTILVIDDDTSVREMLREALTQAGFAVVPVADAADAFSQLSQGIDLVLLDLVMPRAAMDGFAFLSTARTRGELANAPVVVMSGLGDAVTEAMDPATASALRIVSVVTKPVDVAVLISVIRTALETPDRS